MREHVSAEAVVVDAHGHGVLAVRRAGAWRPVWVAVEPRHLLYLVPGVGQRGGIGADHLAARGLDGSFVPLRELGRLDDVERDAVASVLAQARWHAGRRQCPACGSPTVPARRGRSVQCSGCGVEEFARTDPEVLVLPEHGGRVLLVRNATWPAGMFGPVSGYVDPGESAEDAVVREVLEETGLRVTRSGYLWSSPYPYPHCLMLAFMAEVETPHWQASEEIADARWYSREELAESLARGATVLPGLNSPGRRLVERWLADGAARPAP